MRLNVYEYGEEAGMPIVCLHGVSGHGARFASLAERLEGRRVLALDLRGHGYSGWEPPWTTETHVADVLETLDDLRIRTCELLGFSFGGRVAAAVAAAEPARFERLCLLDPALSLPASECLERAEIGRVDLSFETHEEAVEQALSEDGFLVSTPREVLEEDAREHLFEREDGRLTYRYLQSASVAAWGEMARPAPRPTDIETLVVQGDQSWIDLDVDRLLPGASIVTVSAGHSLLWDAFDETSRAVAEFLAG